MGQSAPRCTVTQLSVRLLRSSWTAPSTSSVLNSSAFLCKRIVWLSGVPDCVYLIRILRSLWEPARIWSGFQWSASKEKRHAECAWLCIDPVKPAHLKLPARAVMYSRSRPTRPTVVPNAAQSPIVLSNGMHRGQSARICPLICGPLQMDDRMTENRNPSYTFLFEGVCKVLAPFNGELFFRFTAHNALSCSSNFLKLLKTS